MKVIEYVLIALVAMGLLAGIVFLILHLTKKKNGDTGAGTHSSGSDLIDSLKSRGAKMYGARQCGNTQAQLRILGGNPPGSPIYTQCSNAVHADMNQINQACLNNSYLCKQQQQGRCMNYSAAYPTWCFGNHCCSGVMERDQLMQKNPCAAAEGTRPVVTMTSAREIPVGSAGDVFKYIFGLQWADPVNWVNWIIDAFKEGLEIGTDVLVGGFFYLWNGDAKMFGVGKWFRDNIPDNPIKASNNSQVVYDICKPPENYKGKAKMGPNGYMVFSGWSDQQKRAWATKYDVKWDDLSKAPNDWYAMQLFKKQDCYGMFCTENPGGGECVKGFCAKDDKGNIIPYVPFKWPKSNSAGIKLGTPTSKIYTDQQVCWNAANCVYDYNKPRTAENCPCGDP